MAPAPVEIIAARIRQDVPFPEFNPLWSESFELQDEPARTAKPVLGATIKAFIRNTSATNFPVASVSFESADLAHAIAFAKTKTARMYPANLRFSELSTNQVRELTNAGDPTWWKADPAVVAPGGYSEVTIRLRRLPAKESVSLSIGQASVRLQIQGQTPERSFRSLSFGPALDKVYAYLHGPARMGRPARIFIDDADDSAHCVSAADTNLDLVPLVISLSTPLARGSFHCFRAEWADGSMAVAGSRAFHDDLVYGMWGYINKGNTEEERTRFYLNDLKEHNVNAVMYSYGGGVGDHLSGKSGLTNSRAWGIRAMRTWPGKDLNPLCYFLKDEPDAHDYAVSQLEAPKRLGALGQAVVQLGNEIRERDPVTPQLVNVDNTFKPENWYMYGQLPDIYCADPYFQEQQKIVWSKRPSRAGHFLKPTYVLGVATIAHWACEPRPLHIILNAVAHTEPGDSFRYATPEEKTIELFYALGGGATGFSYWWYTPYGEFKGCGADDPGAVALWKQIGLLGAQVRTAGPLIVQGCPASIPVTAPAGVWSRTLAIGLDSLVVLIVNDKVASDRLGTVVAPIEKLQIRVQSPAWLQPKEVFEILPEQIKEVQWTSEGSQAVLNLGTLDIARLVVITSDANLHASLAELHKAAFAETVSRLAGAK